MTQQFQSLCAQVHKFDKIFDAATVQEDPDAVAAYMRYFINPWIKNPRAILQVCHYIFHTSMLLILYLLPKSNVFFAD